MEYYGSLYAILAPPVIAFYFQKILVYLQDAMHSVGAT